jgi:hypothetical protein
MSGQFGSTTWISTSPFTLHLISLPSHPQAPVHHPLLHMPNSTLPLRPLTPFLALLNLNPHKCLYFPPRRIRTLLMQTVKRTWPPVYFSLHSASTKRHTISLTLRLHLLAAMTVVAPPFLSRHHLIHNILLHQLFWPYSHRLLIVAHSLTLSSV